MKSVKMAGICATLIHISVHKVVVFLLFCSVLRNIKKK